LALVALARARGDVAAELLRRVGVDLEDVINFTCGAVELAKFLEDCGISSIPE
jgi:predicted amino acid racemase